MNNKPVMSRLILVTAILVIFGWSIYPLQPRDFYTTFTGMLTKKSDKLDAALKLAKEKEAKNKDMYPSIALEQATDELNVFLPDYVNLPNMMTNRDVIRRARQEAAGSIKLGLDLAGGTEFIISVVPEAAPTAATVDSGKDDKLKMDVSTAAIRDRVMEILRNRIDKSGLNEPEIAPQGDDRVTVKVPVSTEAEKEELKKLIQMSAKLQFRMVAENSQELVSQYDQNPENFIPPVGVERMLIERTDSQGKRIKPEEVFIEVRPQMDGTNVTGAVVVTNEFGQRQILLEFNGAGSKQFGDVTSKNIGRRLGIVLDGTLYSAPTIQSAIYGNAQITGEFSVEESSRIATALVCGNLPAKIKTDAIFDTDPTLGKESVQSGKVTCYVGFGLVVVFMVLMYHMAGLVAVIALFANVVLLMGALAAFGATLTLPGIAGILLTIGMAVDANVLIYERIREEIESHKTLHNAIELGFSRAFTTILDSNLTTLLAAGVLYWQGSGAVKGFAVTLSIGILSSMFTAITLTHLLFDLGTRYNLYRKFTMTKVFHNPNFNFVKWWRPVIISSIATFVLAIGVVVYKGKSALSIDFTGGSQMTLAFAARPDTTAVQNALSEAKYDAKVTFKSTHGKGGQMEVVIQTPKAVKGSDSTQSPMQGVLALLNQKFPDAKFVEGNETTLGSFVGAHFARGAILAVLLAFVGMIIYISLRFELSFAIGGIVALFHDVVITIGIVLLLGNQMSLTMVAAVLTIIGYSINDTIVVFDRIRENLGLRKDITYLEIINLSLNQTLSRTLMTSVATLTSVVALLIFGGAPIYTFALTMLIGILCGTYSSICIASPLVAIWHKRIAGIKEDSRITLETLTKITGVSAPAPTVKE